MLSLDELLKIGPDVSEDELRARNLLPPKPAPVSPAAIPTNVSLPGVAVTPMSRPVVPSRSAPANPAPDIKPMVPPNVAGPQVVPMQPPAPLGPQSQIDLNAPRSSLMSFPSREEARRRGEDLSAPAGAGAVIPATESGKLQTEVNRLRDERANPWGSPENHPGFWGKLGHVASRIGNIAGDIVAPSTVGLIPGTELNRQIVEANAERKLEGAKKAESETGLRGAEEKNVESETKKREVENKQTLVEDAEKNIVGWQDEQGQQHSLDDPKTPEAIKTIALQSKGTKAGPTFEKDENGNIVALSVDKDGKTSSEVVYHGDPKVKTETKDVLVNGKPHAMVFDVTNPNDQENFGKQLKDLGETKAPPEPGNYQPVTDARGNTVGWVDPKSRNFLPVTKIAGISQAATGNAGATTLPQKPTTQMRNVGAQAQVAVDGIPGVVDEITRMKDSLGPIVGRWNDFIQGKVGTENPEFAGLRADLLMLSSAVALAHARGRLPENLREEFDQMINAPKQTADNIISVINHIKPWMKRLSDIGIDETGGAETPFEKFQRERKKP